MDRRESLKFIGGVGTSALSGYGFYKVFVRDLDAAAGPPGSETWEYEPPATADGAETRDGELLLGVSSSEQDLQRLGPFEDWLGKRHAVVGSFVDMGAEGADVERLVERHLDWKWQRGHVPHLSWQPYLPERDDTSQEICREIADGKHDEVLQRWADALADWAQVEDGPDRRFFVNLAPEMNGDWAPWSPAVGDDTEADFVAMWRHVHDTLADAGLESHHVNWIWALDNTTRDVDREACYPGDEYVDWAGIHGYNWLGWGVWLTPEEVYGETVETIRSITDKPIAITELGCSADTGDGSTDPVRKDQWIRYAYRYFEREDVRMTLWFNVDKETDWSVFDADSGLETVTIDGDAYGVYPGYRKRVAVDDVLPTHPEHPRRLTDEEFAGRF